MRIVQILQYFLKHNATFLINVFFLAYPPTPTPTPRILFDFYNVLLFCLFFLIFIIFLIFLIF